MTGRPVLLFVLLAVAACVRTTVPAHPRPPPRKQKPAQNKPKKAAPTKPAPAGKPMALPADFKVTSPRKPRAPFLKPAAMWRFLLSRLTTLRADARARNEDILVSFEPGAFHVTDRAGGRRSWRLPEGLRLLGVPAHVVLGADLSTAVFGPDGALVLGTEEITVVEARIEAGDGDVEIFRLVAKGGEGFRSISSHG